MKSRRPPGRQKRTQSGYFSLSSVYYYNRLSDGVQVGLKIFVLQKMRFGDRK